MFTSFEPLEDSKILKLLIICLKMKMSFAAPMIFPPKKMEEKTKSLAGFLLFRIAPCTFSSAVTHTTQDRVSPTSMFYKTSINASS